MEQACRTRRWEHQCSAPLQSADNFLVGFSIIFRRLTAVWRGPVNAHYARHKHAHEARDWGNLVE